jgi:hypothetical protein
MVRKVFPLLLGAAVLLVALLPGFASAGTQTSVRIASQAEFVGPNQVVVQVTYQCYTGTGGSIDVTLMQSSTKTVGGSFSPLNIPCTGTGKALITVNVWCDGGCPGFQQGTAMATVTLNNQFGQITDTRIVRIR